jgi:phosphatidylglycerol lysyltransferase
MVMTRYDVLAQQWLRWKMGYRRTLLASFIGNAVSFNTNVFTGAAARYRVYGRWGYTLKEVWRISLFCYVTFLLGFLMVGGVIFTFEPLQLPAALHLPFGSLRGIGLMFWAVIAAYFAACAWRLRLGGNAMPELSFPKLRIAGHQIIAGTADWLLAAFALYLLLPAGAPPFADFVGMFLVAQFAGQISQAPAAGLGILEAAMLLMLNDFLPSSGTLGALLIYRCAYYFLPLLVAGIAFIWSEVHRRRQPHG